MRTKNRITDEDFTPEEREIIKNAMYRMFIYNNAAIVIRFGDELVPFEIQKYMLLITGIKNPSA